MLLPFLLSLFSSKGDVIQNFPRTRAELKIYILLSVVVYGATAFATMSLGYDGVTYVTKVVFKSAKLIPTMLVGVLLDARAARLGQAVKKKNYGVYEYSYALLLSAGAAGFCMNANNIETDLEETDVSNDSSTSMIGGHVMGLLLLTASVFCDAIVPNIQEKLMNGNSLQSTNPQSNQIDVEIKPFIRNENTAQPTSSSTQKGMSSLSLMVNTNAIGFTMLLLTATLSASIVTITSNIIKHPHYFLLLLTVGVGLSSAVLAYTERCDAEKGCHCCVVVYNIPESNVLDTRHVFWSSFTWIAGWICWSRKKVTHEHFQRVCKNALFIKCTVKTKA